MSVYIFKTRLRLLLDFVKVECWVILCSDTYHQATAQKDRIGISIHREEVTVPVSPHPGEWRVGVNLFLIFANLTSGMTSFFCFISFIDEVNLL